MMILYLIATVAVFVICFLAYRSKPEKYADLMGVSALLALVFCIGNAITVLYHFPDALLASPVLDLFLVGMIFRSNQQNAERWKSLMVATLVAQLTLHAVTIGLWKTGVLTEHGLRTYLDVINAIFIVQLLTLATVGVGHGLDCLRGWLSDRRHSALAQDAGQ
jgi:hypothetical protein